MENKQMVMIGSAMGVIVLFATIPGAIDLMSNSPYTPLPNAVGWWKLNDASAATVADSSGRNNPGIVHGTPTFQYAFGNVVGMRFAGTGQYISVPDQTYFALNGGPETMAAWIISDAKDSAGHNYFTHGNWFMNQRGTNELSCGFSVGGGQFVRAVVSSTDWSINVAIHILCTWDGSTVTLYKNGVFYSTGSTMLAQDPQARDLGIAGDVISGQYWHGGEADVRLYNSIFNSAQIDSVYTGTNHTNNWNTQTLGLWVILTMIILVIIIKSFSSKGGAGGSA